jgi:hypothetical protein
VNPRDARVALRAEHFGEYCHAPKAAFNFSFKCHFGYKHGCYFDNQYDNEEEFRQEIQALMNYNAATLSNRSED